MLQARCLGGKDEAELGGGGGKAYVHGEGHGDANAYSRAVNRRDDGLVQFIKTKGQATTAVSVDALVLVLPRAGTEGRRAP